MSEEIARIKIKNAMSKLQYAKIVSAILVNSDGSKTLDYYENSKLESAVLIEIYYS